MRAQPTEGELQYLPSPCAHESDLGGPVKIGLVY